MAVKGIFYVLLFVSDLERSKRFYRDSLGWRLDTDDERLDVRRSGQHDGLPWDLPDHAVRTPAFRGSVEGVAALAARSLIYFSGWFGS